MVDINFLNRKYFCKNYEVPFRLKCNSFIYLYPIKVRDWDIFEECFDILSIDKNKTQDPKIIQMSYLKFLFFLIERKDLVSEEIKTKLYLTLKLCFREKDIRLGYDKGKPVIIICEDDKIKAKITAKEFNDIKRIIFYQNIENYDDEEISEDIKKIINEYKQVKNGNIIPLTLEDKLIFLGNEIGKDTNELLNMTYREFSKRFSMSVDKMDYVINKTAELSGNFKVDKPMPHLLYKDKTGKYDKYFVDKDGFVDKINNA